MAGRKNLVPQSIDFIFSFLAASKGLSCSSRLRATLVRRSTTRSPVEPNPADPYMTLMGYFNSLRDRAVRRLIEDKVR